MSDNSQYKLRCLLDIGIDPYVRRSFTVISPVTETTESVDDSVATSDSNAGAWDTLESEVEVCTRCALHQGRTQTVFGVGNRRADWMLIGEAPGFEEDRKGEPFVGRAGKLLDRMLSAIHLDRTQVYITNTVKCRPPDNRNPRPEEIMECEDYLQRQITLIQPKIILALGGVAANALLRCDTPVGRLRGRIHQLEDTDIPIVVTYHPAYLLRSPQQKRAAWEDLQLAQRVVNPDSPGSS